MACALPVAWARRPSRTTGSATGTAVRSIERTGRFLGGLVLSTSKANTSTLALSFDYRDFSTPERVSEKRSLCQWQLEREAEVYEC